MGSKSTFIIPFGNIRDHNCKITFERIMHSLNPVRHNKLYDENTMNNIDLPAKLVNLY
jgi:hypothetical protein